MCTIVVLHRVHPEHPLVVAANRDEFYARPALSPQVLSDSPRVVAGVDCEHGGTWLGAHEHGLFVGLTNQRVWAPHARAPRSRGELALSALRTGSTEGVRELLGRIDPREYNAFNLIWGDADRLFVGYGRRDRREVTVHRLPEGIHALANDRLGSSEFPKAGRAADLVRPVADRSWPELVRGLSAMLADHARPPLDEVPEPPGESPFPREIVRELHAICTHTPVYGTRSSTILAIDAGRVARYLYSDGPPCTHPHRDVTELLRTPTPS